MRSLLLLLLFAGSALTAAPPPSFPGALVVIGGGRLPESIVQQFLLLAGGNNARIVVIPTASASADAPNAATVYLERWKKHSLLSLTLLHTRQHRVANQEEFVRPLREATGVWISGGDQSRLTAAYRGTAVQRELKDLLARGGVIAGTSAGAAVMSEVMITGGRRKATLGSGLGLLRGIVVDQHFLKRDRVERLLGVLQLHPDHLGLGIDESTAIIVRGEHFSVLGESYVMAIRPGKNLPQIRIFRSGDRVKLPELTILPSR